MEVVTQNMVVEATTEEIRKQFTDLATELAAIGDREQRIQKYDVTIATSSEATKNVANLFSTKEKQHIGHVRETLKRISIYPEDMNPHDFTKDGLYFFVTSAKFACKVQGPSMDKLFDMEVNRHYTEEPHHPEYEKIHGIECSKFDILEMAVDRMSRNIQVSGTVVLSSMEKYLPEFTLGDKKQKVAMYLGFVEEYKDLTEKVYYEMYKK